MKSGVTQVFSCTVFMYRIGRSIVLSAKVIS